MVLKAAHQHQQQHTSDKTQAIMKSSVIIDWNDLELLEIIGEGSFGVVRRAKLRQQTGEDPSAVTWKEVAVKMPKPDCALPVTREDFFHEAEILMCVPSFSVLPISRFQKTFMSCFPFLPHPSFVG